MGSDSTTSSHEARLQNVKSTFVSCTFASISKEVDDQSVMMCQTEVIGPNCTTLQDFENVSISKILASEGSDIIFTQNAGMNDLKCFADTSALKSWYELVNFLSAGHFEVGDLDRKWAVGGRWKFYFVAPLSWTLVFETQFENFTQRHCELAFTPAPADQELDLFNLSLKLYEAQRESNKQIHMLQNRCKHLESQKNQLQTEHDEWEARLRVRDQKTRSVIVTLLNEKKGMIRTLQERLERGKEPLDVPDSYLMNKFINQPVSRMTSPRKRPQPQPHGSKTPSPRKRTKRPILKNETSWDDFSAKGFEFLGINRERTPSNTPSSDNLNLKPSIQEASREDVNIDEQAVVGPVENSGQEKVNPPTTSFELVDSLKPVHSTHLPETTPTSSSEEKSIVGSDATPDTAEETEVETEIETEVETEVETEAE
ncbi:LAFA_0C02674g1_1 [Lachancea sp. 'fantastica']|nr:LAFA_0C02674g1_1 [Lachancea sp. 'fantastica']